VNWSRLPTTISPYPPVEISAGGWHWRCPVAPTQNHLILQIPRTVQARLLSTAQSVALMLKDVLYSGGKGADLLRCARVFCRTRPSRRQRRVVYVRPSALRSCSLTSIARGGCAYQTREPSRQMDGVVESASAGNTSQWPIGRGKQQLCPHQPALKHVLAGCVSGRIFESSAKVKDATAGDARKIC
jgi:hypothetical protein